MGHLQQVVEEALRWQSQRDPSAERHEEPANCGDLPFLIQQDGTWLYRGSPIVRKELVQLFASVLRREEDGGYWLVTPVERGRIEVEDAPFRCVTVDIRGEGIAQELLFKTNVGEVVRLDDNHPIRSRDGRVYLGVRAGNVNRYPIEARLDDEILQQVRRVVVVHGDDGPGVWSASTFFPLTYAVDPLTYAAVSGPSHGMLLKNGVATSQFTQADIHSGGVTYREDDSDVSTLSVTEAVSSHTANTSLHFEITATAGITAPVIVVDNGLGEAAERFLQASGRTVETADRLLHAAQTGNNEIADLNRRIMTRLDELDAHQTTW